MRDTCAVCRVADQPAQAGLSIAVTVLVDARDSTP